jgi:putative membrane protein
MIEPSLQINDRKAWWIIGLVSLVVFAAVVILSRVTLEVDLGFDPHLFAHINGALNTAVSILLIVALVFVKQKKYQAHKTSMMGALLFSLLFLVSYIAHHLFAGDTSFGGVGGIKIFYYIILSTHIVLAGTILPLILFTAYRGLTGEFSKHKKLAKYTWPLWLYVSVTGVIVYVMISPYYT